MMQYDRRTIEDHKKSIEPTGSSVSANMRYLLMIAGAFVLIFVIL